MNEVKLYEDNYQLNHTILSDEVINDNIKNYIVGKDNIDKKLSNPFYYQDKIFCENYYRPLAYDLEKLYNGDVVTNCSIINKYYVFIVYYNYKKIKLEEIQHALPQKWTTFNSIGAFNIRLVPVKKEILKYLY